MKVGVAYNLFDGEELLESSIKSIRDCVDYICVVYQKVSYYGDKASADLEVVLNSLVENGLIDEIFLYERDFNSQQSKKLFEIEKRNIGLELCRKAGMTYFLSADVDEYYDSKQFKKALEYIYLNDIDASACSLFYYIKTPEYRLVADQDEENYYVPFVCKIFNESIHGNDFFSTYCDSCRIITPYKKFYLFPIQTVVMHHMSTIRNNLEKKYLNSSSNDGGIECKKKMTKDQEDIISWRPEENRIGNTEFFFFNNKIVKKVKNIFNVPTF
ncbi:hypothetical protein [Succinivibrio dextrinosolvens]|nr:hypothetical protein [Succinivibrio dextrinosolvens]